MAELRLVFNFLVLEVIGVQAILRLSRNIPVARVELKICNNGLIRGPK